MKVNDSAPLAQTSVTFVATVTGSGKPNGTVNFYEDGLFFIGGANLTGNTASLTTSIDIPGICTVTAQYLADASNNPSTSAGLNQIVTGSTLMYVQGQTNTLTHIANVTVTIQ